MRNHPVSGNAVRYERTWFLSYWAASNSIFKSLFWTVHDVSILFILFVTHYFLKCRFELSPEFSGTNQNKVTAKWTNQYFGTFSLPINLSFSSTFCFRLRRWQMRWSLATTWRQGNMSTTSTLKHLSNVRISIQEPLNL